MNLHDDREAFDELLIGAANELAIPTDIIEKDYYVTIALKKLSEKLEDMVFKGGTSLTKCYQLLNRFSEDIDISYTAESGIPGEARKKQLKKAVVAVMDELGFPITNIDKTRSRRNYNCYRASYPSIYEKTNYLKPELVVETYVALLPFPPCSGSKIKPGKTWEIRKTPERLWQTCQNPRKRAPSSAARPFWRPAPSP